MLSFRNLTFNQKSKLCIENENDEGLHTLTTALFPLYTHSIYRNKVIHITKKKKYIITIPTIQYRFHGLLALLIAGMGSENPYPTLGIMVTAISIANYYYYL